MFTEDFLNIKSKTSRRKNCRKLFIYPWKILLGGSILLENQRTGGGGSLWLGFSYLL